MQDMFRNLFQQRSARAVNNAFRLARRPRREHHIKRVIELDLFEDDFLGPEGGNEVVIGDGVADIRRVGAVKGIGHDDDLFQAVDPLDNIVNLFADVVLLAVIVITVNGDHHGWFDLAKAVYNTLNAEIR